MPLTSKAFEYGEPIPKKYLKEGENVSPPLKWKDVPQGTKELVIFMEDPEGTGGNFSHWVVWGISPDSNSLSEGVKTGSTEAGGVQLLQGKNGFLDPGYDGPLPWPGSGVHHYMFRIFALDKATQLDQGSYKEQLQKQMYGHVIGQGLLVGTYERKQK